MNYFVCIKCDNKIKTMKADVKNAKCATCRAEEYNKLTEAQRKNIRKAEREAANKENFLLKKEKFIDTNRRKVFKATADLYGGVQKDPGLMSKLTPLESVKIEVSSDHINNRMYLYKTRRIADFESSIIRDAFLFGIKVEAYIIRNRKPFSIVYGFKMKNGDSHIKEEAVSTVTTKQIKIEKQLKLYGMRTATCHTCHRSLTSEYDLICDTCSWIKCYCGSCGCNYRARY